MSITKQIVFTFLLLSFFILFFGFSSIDMQVQDNFFDYSTHQWIVDRELQPYKFIFYDGIKKILILFAFSFLVALVFFRKNKQIKAYNKGIIIVLLSAILIPFIVGGLKKYTNMPCPKNETHYGGVYPSTKVWESYPTRFNQPSSIRCYPAGHASGGFALLSLFFLFKTRKNKVMVLLLALSIGWGMGIYKMLIGDHFFSHTLITMLLAWLIVLLIAKFIYKESYN
ncbi:MAG: PAP2 family protein [uncultured Sulfurovum sp.]|uniref:PAP2 family protein n=1 Tax=uncultured Sulfurovum sp. TaxID=269237 RepID=A0A6S6SCR5_9BACT|nr:MAG: PAP2 family protein [uncultured Sulfurovum sp.]